MGLDMYLERRNKDDKAMDAWEQVMYWRKANQVRKWFSENLELGVENCEFSYVTKQNLEDLIAKCEMVLKCHDLAHALLPTSSGFFFGSMGYDDWYFMQLEDTVTGLKKVIAETAWETQVVAYYEWW